jgi:hypothetical protein
MLQGKLKRENKGKKNQLPSILLELSNTRLLGRKTPLLTIKIHQDRWFLTLVSYNTHRLKTTG